MAKLSNKTLLRKRFALLRAIEREGMTDREKEWGGKASRFLKAELKRAGLGYKDLAEPLNKHGLEETETSITGSRGTFAVSFFLACLAVLELEGVRLEDL
jgi:Domain of unknown function (DUF6471)